MKNKCFPLGVVVVEVHCVGGQVTIEDFDPDDLELAQDFATEVCHFSDVTKTVLWVHGERTTYQNPAKTPESHS